VWRSTLNIYDFVRGKSVIVVGNNSTALEVEQGELIDSYDIVVRFGKGIPDGYERYIGRRTDIWVTGGFRQGLREKFPSHTQVLYNVSTLTGRPHVRPDYPHTPMYSMESINALNEFYGGKEKRLSAGAVAGLWLVNEIATYSSLTFINFDFFKRSVKFIDAKNDTMSVASSWHLPIAVQDRIDTENPENHPAHDPLVEERIFDDIRSRENVHFIGKIHAESEFVQVDRMAWDSVRKRI